MKMLKETLNGFVRGSDISKFLYHSSVGSTRDALDVFMPPKICLVQF